MSHYGIISMYAHFFMVPMHVTLQNGTTYTNAYLTTECMVLSMYVTLRIYGMVPMHVILYMAWYQWSHYMAWYQIMSHYSIVPICYTMA